MKEVGVGTRVLNFLIDTLLIWLISYLLFKWYNFYVYYYGYQSYQFYLFFYATLIIYYLVFELLFSRTPAKFISLTKVRHINGGRAAWYQIVFRTLLRLTLIDPFFIPFIGRTLHDAASKTRVVEV
jgi:uncharacterized RDD family membrane protein YckC